MQNKKKLVTEHTEYLEVPGGQVAFDDTKMGEPLVICVLGLGDVRVSYRFVVPQLVEAMRCPFLQRLREGARHDA